MCPSTHDRTEAEPQGNAMWSVRVTAVGAVIVASVSFLTAPARACDDRFIKKCEKQAAAAAAAAEESAAVPAVRRKLKRVNVVNSRRSRHTRLVKRSRAPGFTVRRERDTNPARMTALPPESVLARRFRGFIDPQPIAQNAFELLRRPRLVALNFEPAVAAPLPEVADNAPPLVAETEAPAASITPKQDRMASKPAAMELASAESKRVTLAEPAPRPADPPPAEPAKPQPILTEAPPPPPASDQPSQFSFHKLVLALCGALGAASALRFIVGA